MKRKTLKILLCSTLIIVISLMIFPLYQIISESNYYSNNSCPYRNIYFNDSLSFVKSPDDWHLSYSNHNYSIISSCVTNAMFVKFNKLVIGGTSYGAFEKGHMNIYDCNQNIVFKIIIANDIRSILHKNDKYYSLFIALPNDIYVGYVNSAEFYTNNFTIYNYNSIEPTKEPLINVINKFNVTILNNSTFISNYLLVTSLIGYLNIESINVNQGFDIKYVDTCRIIFDVSIILAVITFLITIALVIYWIWICRMNKKNNDDFELLRIGRLNYDNARN